MNNQPKTRALTAQRRSASDADRSSPPVICYLLAAIPFPKRASPQPFLHCGLPTVKLTKMRLTLSETKAKLPRESRFPPLGTAKLPEFPMSDTATLPSPPIHDSRFFDAL